jgi:hypothetical protein
MKTTVLGVMLCIIILAAAQSVLAQPPAHTKVMPYSLRYPLIRPVPYESTTGDPYKRAFGVNRLLKGVVVGDVADSIRESYSFYHVYGGYGVLGRGEDVFTSQAARVRKKYRDN